MQITGRFFELVDRISAIEADRRDRQSNCTWNPATRKQVPEGPWQTTRYELSRDGRSEEKLPAGAKRAIKEAVEFVCSKTATELSELTHEFSRSWMEARDGQPLNIYIDIIPDDEYETREREIDALHRELMAAWK